MIESCIYLQIRTWERRRLIEEEVYKGKVKMLKGGGGKVARRGR